VWRSSTRGNPKSATVVFQPGTGGLHGRQECFLGGCQRERAQYAARREPPSDGAGDHYDNTTTSAPTISGQRRRRTRCACSVKGSVLVCVPGGEDLRLIGEHRLSGRTKLMLHVATRVKGSSPICCIIPETSRC